MKRVKVLEITTSTCGICKSITPMISKAVELLGEKIDFEKRQVTWDDDVVKEHNIRQVPTFLFFDGEKLVDKHVGAIMMQDFIKKTTEIYNKING